MKVTFYNYVLSGNCYKFRLLANLLNVSYESVAIDFHPGQEHKSEKLLQLNPAGTLPILSSHVGLASPAARRYAFLVANR